METAIATAFNDLNPREPRGRRTPLVGEVKLHGSSKLAEDTVSPGIHPSRSRWYRGELKHRGQGGLHRGRTTAHERALCGSTPPDPLDLSDEGLTQPWGYWGHSVSLRHLNTEGPVPFLNSRWRPLLPL